MASVDSSGKVNKRYSEAEARRIMIHCVAGLEYLHSRNCVHRVL